MLHFIPLLIFAGKNGPLVFKKEPVRRAQLIFNQSIATGKNPVCAEGLYVLDKFVSHRKNDPAFSGTRLAR